MQHATVGGIRERDVLERDGPARPLEGVRVGALLDVRLLVQHGEGPLGAREVTLERGDLAADGLHRIEQLRDVAHHQQQAAERQRARLNVGDPQEEDQRRADPHEQPEGDAEPPLPQRESYPAPHPLVRPADKAVSLPLLLPEHLHDAEGAEDLVNHR